MNCFDLLPFMDKNPFDLGYGERKRLSLASVVAMNTPALVLDEPTAGLDPFEIKQLGRVLDDLSSQGKTVLIITHDMDFVAEQIQRIICLSHGQKLYDGDSRILFAQSDLMKQAGLFPPQMVRLSARFHYMPPAMTPAEFVEIKMHKQC